MWFLLFVVSKIERHENKRKHAYNLKLKMCNHYIHGIISAVLTSPLPPCLSVLFVTSSKPLHRCSLCSSHTIFSELLTTNWSAEMKVQHVTYRGYEHWRKAIAQIWTQNVDINTIPGLLPWFPSLSLRQKMISGLIGAWCNASIWERFFGKLSITQPVLIPESMSTSSICQISIF